MFKDKKEKSKGQKPFEKKENSCCDHQQKSFKDKKDQEKPVGKK